MILGLKFALSRRNLSRIVSGVLMSLYHVTHVTLRDLRNALQPVRRDCGVVAVASNEGRPSKTMTRSARYVAYGECYYKEVALKRITHHNEVVLNNEGCFLSMHNKSLDDPSSNDTLL